MTKARPARFFADLEISAAAHHQRRHRCGLFFIALSSPFASGQHDPLTLTVLLTLALGIGANTAIFTVDFATLLAPLPYPQPDQLVIVWSRIQNFHNGVSAGDFLDWKQQSTVFQDLCALSGDSYNLATKDQPEYVEASLEHHQTPDVGQPLLMGRYFLPEEGLAGRDHVVILTYKLWRKLGANPHIVGTTLRLE